MKYIHFMLHGNPEHNGSIITMINENKDYFKSKEHTFLIFRENVYEKYKNYENVMLADGDRIKLLNKCSTEYDYIFIHSLSLAWYEYLFVKKSCAAKIIWVVWSHDLYMGELITQGFKNTLRQIKKHTLFLVKKYRVKQFKGIGIGFKYDAFEIKRLYGYKINIFNAPYGYKKNSKEITDKFIEAEKEDFGSNKPLKIMIGHSAYEFLNHIEIMKSLYKFKEENMIVSLILSYGDMNYAEKVKKTAIELFGDKAEIIEKYMDDNEYIKFLMGVDISIIDYKYQIALGNIYKLLYLDKKIFFTKDGFLKKSFALENIEVNNISDIKNMSFEEFSNPVKNPDKGKSFAKNIIVDEKQIILAWQNTLKELENS